ncbi:MAG: LamG domain-containing protein [Planctomycetes bacterium]|jgi:hypothetical protein|nr:LamG domain-containing protein [Planctomycetota bacterium]
MSRVKQAVVGSGIALLLMVVPTRLLGANDPNLIGWWPLDEGSGTIAMDASGKGNDAKLQGDPQWVQDGRLGAAVKFNGTSDYLAVPDSDSLDIKGDRLTLAAWIRGNAWATSHIVRKIPDTGTGSIYFIRVQSTLLRGDLATPTGTIVVQGKTPLRVQEWVHAALVYDGAEGRIYVNGVLDGQAVVSGKIAESNNELRIGRGEPAGYFNGSIDDVRIYNRALTVAEIKQLDPPKLQARAPQPANGAVGVTTALLQWTAGDTAVVHDIYLDMDPNLGSTDRVGSRLPVALYYHAPGLQPGTTYYWRVDEIEADMTTVHTGNVWSFTTQAVTAYQPKPTDGDAGVTPTVTLTWLPGRNALKHHVYFSDSRDAVAQAAAGADRGEQKETTFTPTGLQEATTYYWRVDEVLIDGTIQAGLVWSFSTYLLVDDFESYTDVEGGRIYETWIDGWTNSTGSTVGYTQAPFAERTIVHGGLQAMPLDYNNAKAPFYSEAELEFATPEDWTVGEVKTLVLFVRGRAGNGPAPLYVTLRDASNRTATVSYPDPGAVGLTRWVEWKIALSDFTGVSLARIKKLTIGLGDKASSSAGGRGVIFVDDIRLIKS